MLQSFNIFLNNSLFTLLDLVVYGLLLVKVRKKKNIWCITKMDSCGGKNFKGVQSTLITKLLFYKVKCENKRILSIL